MTLHKQKRRMKRRFRILYHFILRFYCVFKRSDNLSKSAAATQIVAKQIPCKHVVAKRCQHCHCQVGIVRRIRIRDDVVGFLRIVHDVVFDRLAVRAIRYVIIGV